MKFTYQAYRNLLHRLADSGYGIISCQSGKEDGKCAILRHDIDFSLEKALQFAMLEREENVRSTYFVLLTSDFYNPFSEKNAGIIRRIAACGHEIGLHFDETAYPDGIGADELKERILKEVGLLETLTEKPVSVVSMHRPSDRILNADLEIPGMINSYGTKYFREYKYVSDSRMQWREDVCRIISEEAFSKLHILTHAFWYEENEKTIQEQISRFIRSADRERYDTMRDNIRDLSAIMEPPC